MFNLSENNLILVVIFLLLFLILLLSQRPNNSCIRERLDNEYHKHFDNSNKILCPPNEGVVLNKDLIINPKKVINEVVSDVKKSTEEISSAINEVEDVVNNTENEKINKIMEIVNKIKAPTEELERISQEHAIQEESVILEENVEEEHIKNVAKEVSKIVSESSIPENVITQETVPTVTQETVPTVTQETAPDVVPIEKRIAASVVSSENVATNTVAVEPKVSESNDGIVNIPEPYNGDFLMGYSVGGFSKDDLSTSVAIRPDPKCNIYRDAVNKLNLTGYIKNDQVNSSWNDSFGTSCGSI